jgi:hypothetical protein
MTFTTCSKTPYLVRKTVLLFVIIKNKSEMLFPNIMKIPGEIDFVII